MDPHHRHCQARIKRKVVGFFCWLFFVLKSRTHTMIVINATAEANLDSTANLMARLSEDLSQENNLNVKSRHCKSKFLCFSEITWPKGKEKSWLKKKKTLCFSEGFGTLQICQIIWIHKFFLKQKHSGGTREFSKRALGLTQIYLLLKIFAI